MLGPILFKWTGFIVFQSELVEKNLLQHTYFSFISSLTSRELQGVQGESKYELDLFVSKIQCTWTNTVLPQYLRSVQGHFLFKKCAETKKNSNCEKKKKSSLNFVCHKIFLQKSFWSLQTTNQQTEYYTINAHL